MFKNKKLFIILIFFLLNVYAFAKSNIYLSPVTNFSPESTSIILSSESSKNLTVLPKGYIFPEWISKKLKQHLKTSAVDLILSKSYNEFELKEEVIKYADKIIDFLINNGGFCFKGTIEDIPEDIRSYLEPKEFENGIIVCEKGLSIAIEVFKDVFNHYEDISDNQFIEKFRKNLIFSAQIVNNLNDRVNQEKFPALVEKIINIIGKSDYLDFISGIQSNYAINNQNVYDYDLLKFFLSHMITDAYFYNSIPKAIRKNGLHFETYEIPSDLLFVFLDFIKSSVSLKEIKGSDEAFLNLEKILIDYKFKQKLFEKINILFGNFKNVITSPEQEYNHLSRISRAMKKCDALQHLNQSNFQDQLRFLKDKKNPLSDKSFYELSLLYLNTDNEFNQVLPTVLALMDIGKITDFKNYSGFNDINFANHPKAGAEIIQKMDLLQNLDFSDDLKKLIYLLVKYHGFIGQSKRGEVTDEVFIPLLDEAIHMKNPSIIDAYFIINVIDVSLVKESLLDQNMYDWFKEKSIFLKDIVREGIKTGETSDIILQKLVNKSLADSSFKEDYSLKRLQSIFTDLTDENIRLVVNNVFNGQEKLKEKMFEFLSHQKGSFSFWYPESALNKLSTESRIKILYISLYFADKEFGKSSLPIDIDFFNLSVECNRTDEEILRDENIKYLNTLFNEIQISDITSENFLKNLQNKGITFNTSKTNNATQIKFDSLYVIDDSFDGIQQKLDNIHSLVSKIDKKNPLVFIEKSANLLTTSKVGYMVADFAPFNIRQKEIIDNLRKKFGLDEIVLIIPKGDDSEFGASCAERLFLLKEEFKNDSNISIAVSQANDFISNSKYLRMNVDKTTELFVVTDSQEYEKMLEEERSLITLNNLKKFLKDNNTWVVASSGYFNSSGISRIQIEKKISDINLNKIEFLQLNKKIRFHSTTELRRRLMESASVGLSISRSVLRIIKEFGMFNRKIKNKELTSNKMPIKIVFINITSPQHPVLTEPLGINALVGDLRYVYGNEVDVTVIDTQFGVTSEELMEQLKIIEPDIIGYSAQLESHMRLYSELEMIKKEHWFKKKETDVYVGHNLVTNAHKEVLRRFPWIIAVQGEGELAMRAAVKYRKGEVSLRDIPAAVYILNDIVVENDGEPVDARNLNMPARDVLPLIVRRGADVEMETSRGCGHGVCSFCKKDPFRAHFWQPLPDEIIIRGFESLLSSPEYVRQVSFSDPEFFGGGQAEPIGRKRGKRLFQEIIKLNKKYGRKINIATSIRADSVYNDPNPKIQQLEILVKEKKEKVLLTEDEQERKKLIRQYDDKINDLKIKIKEIEDDNNERIEVLKLAKEAGVDSWFIGIESGSEKQLKRYRKGVSVEENEKAIEILKNLGFRIMYGFIPFDQFADVDDLIYGANFIEKTDSYLEVSFPVNQLKIQSGTPYYDWTLKEGLLGELGKNLHTYDSIYKDNDVQDIADLISRYSREIGSVFYVIKYLYRTKMLNDIESEKEEQDCLRKLYYDYNKLEVDFMKKLSLATKDPSKRTEKFSSLVMEFRKKRLSFVVEIEEFVNKGIIKDENNTLIPEINKIRTLVDSYKTDSLEKIPPLTRKEISKFRKFPHLHIKKLMMHPEFLHSKELQDEFLELALRIKNENELIKLSKVPVIPLSERVKLYRKISDDLKEISYYLITDDKGVFENGNEPDYSKLKLNPIIENFPSFGLGFPARTLYKVEPERADTINSLMQWGRYLTEYGGIVSSYDQTVDRNVWSWNADTGYLAKVLTSSKNGIINNPNYRKVYELGCGGGHNMLTMIKKLANVEWAAFSDINPYALMCTMRQIQDVAKDKKINLVPYLGKGLIPEKVDLLLINPPYLPEAPWESSKNETLEDPYKGTGVIKEIIENGINSLNPDNPDACIVMNYSNLADADFNEYVRAYGQLLEIEVLETDYPVPLKIAKDENWYKWMLTNGLEERDPKLNGGYKYWHRLKVVKIRPKKVHLVYKNGKTLTTILHKDLFSRDNFSKNNFQELTMASKLKIISFLKMQRMPWFDPEWLSLCDLYEYYKDEGLPIFKSSIEKQLHRKVHLSPENLLRELFSEEHFLGRNIISEIYFQGLNPNLSSITREIHRSIINSADSENKSTIKNIFIEYFINFGWLDNFKQYLSNEYHYNGDFEITDIRDYSYGNGVYRLTLRMIDIEKDAYVFIKRVHKEDGIENERPYMRIQREVISSSKEGMTHLPMIFSNNKNLPGLMMSARIEGESLDILLTKTRNMDNFPQDRLVKSNLLTEIECIYETPKHIADLLYNAGTMLHSKDKSTRDKAVDIIAENKRYIRRELYLKGEVDFHTHSIYSDGVLTPEEIVLRGWINGVDAVAITDHMTMDGVLDAIILSEKLNNIKVIPSIEIYSRDIEIGINKIHSIVYFPHLNTEKKFKHFHENFIKKGLSKGYEEIRNAQNNKNDNVEGMRKKFNEIHEKDGLIIPEMSASDDPMLINFARHLKKSYANYFKDKTASQIKTEYLDPIKKLIEKKSSSTISIQTILNFANEHNGIVSIAHILTNRDKRSVKQQLDLIKKLLKKYALFINNNEKFLGIRCLGIYGGGISEDDNKATFEMLHELKNEEPAYKEYPLILLNESDYHHDDRGTFYYGKKCDDGTYSVPHSLFSLAKLYELNRQRETLINIPLNKIGTYIPFTNELESEIITAGAEHAALEALLAVNDSRLSNFRIKLDEDYGRLQHLVRFDEQYMLNSDPGLNVEKGWFLNYAWALEDVKQGIHELSWVLLSERFFKTNKYGLSKRVKLLNEWKIIYSKIWKQYFINGNIGLIKKILNEEFKNNDIRKDEAVSVLIQRLKFGMDNYLEECFWAFLVDYQKRIAYRNVLDKLKKAYGADILGKLARYSSSDSKDSQSSNFECFRGVLSKNFIKRNNLKNQKSIEDIFMNIDFLIEKYLGKEEMQNFQDVIDQIETDALIVMEALFENKNSDNKIILQSLETFKKSA